MRTRLIGTLSLTAALLGGVVFAPAAGAVHEKLEVTGLTASDRLVTFLADTTGGVTDSVKVTGLAGDDLVAIDYRPSTGGLYGIATGDDGARLYVIDADSGVAERVGTTTYAISGDLSMDFNPVVDLVRLVSTDGTNLRVSPVSGALVATDGPLRYAVGDPNEGTAPTVAGVAYTNSDADPATGTELFDIDAALDILALQSPPNNGVLSTRGDLPAPTKPAQTGFDIYTRDGGAQQNWAFVSLFDKGRTTIYEISLATGAATTNFVGNGGQLEVRPHLTDIALPVDQAGF